MAEKTSQTPKIAVIGCGAWGKNLVRNFAELGFLHAICDQNEHLARDYAQKYDVKAHSFAEVLNSDVDAVAIATHAASHCTIAHQALEHDKHVFVEKPIALQVEQAEALCEKALQAGKVLMVGHLMQYHPAFIKLKELVADGTLGQLNHICSHRLNFGKVRTEENIFWSFAPHDISMILSLVGQEPDTVSAISNCYLNQKIADVTTSHLSFPNGVNAHIFVSWLHPYKEQKLVVIGNQCMAVFDDMQDWDKKLLLYPHKIHWQDGILHSNKADAKPVEVARLEPLQAELQHFIDCINGNEKCITDGHEAIRVLRVLQASENSIMGLGQNGASRK